MNHHRVIPRDFFNEAKLLKCLGAFELAVQERRTNGLQITTNFDGEPFEIMQNQGDGTLFCTNYCAFLDGEEIELHTVYNSKDPYPLIGVYKQETYYIFDDNGNFTLNGLE